MCEYRAAAPQRVRRLAGSPPAPSCVRSLSFGVARGPNIIQTTKDRPRPLEVGPLIPGTRNANGHGCRPQSASLWVGIANFLQRLAISTATESAPPPSGWWRRPRERGLGKRGLLLGALQCACRGDTNPGQCRVGMRRALGERWRANAGCIACPRNRRTKEGVFAFTR